MFYRVMIAFYIFASPLLSIQQRTNQPIELLFQLKTWETEIKALSSNGLMTRTIVIVVACSFRYTVFPPIERRFKRSIESMNEKGGIEGEGLENSFGRYWYPILAAIPLKSMKPSGWLLSRAIISPQRTIFLSRHRINDNGGGRKKEREKKKINEYPLSIPWNLYAWYVCHRWKSVVIVARWKIEIHLFIFVQGSRMVIFQPAQPTTLDSAIFHRTKIELSVSSSGFSIPGYWFFIRREISRSRSTRRAILFFSW